MGRGATGGSPDWIGDVERDVCIRDVALLRTVSGEAIDSDVCTPQPGEPVSSVRLCWAGKEDFVACMGPVALSYPRPGPVYRSVVLSSCDVFLSLMWNGQSLYCESSFSVSFRRPVQFVNRERYLVSK